MKKIPVGIDYLKKLIGMKAYYIHKTRFISQNLDDVAEVKFFTRSRKFRKTLNMLTLKYFFDIINCNINCDILPNFFKR